MQQRPVCHVRFGNSEGGREREEEANHETGTNEAAIRNSKLLGSFDEGEFARVTSSRTATALVPCSWNGHVRAIQLLLRIGQFWRRTVNWAISRDFIDHLPVVHAAMSDGVAAPVEVFVGGKSEWVRGLVPAFAAGRVVGAGGAVHRDESIHEYMRD